MVRLKQTLHLKGLPALRAKISMKQSSGIRANIGKRKA